MPRILFIDDDPVTLELMGQAARLLGHQAILARTGADGILKAEEQDPGVIFLDLMMPDMDGLQVLGHLRKVEKTKAIPVIVLSAGASLDDAIVCQAAGAQDYLTKPVQLQLLMDTIKKYTST
jgi:CheY-like chemotaxis protein